jgi:CubicO group peptidase (beta-lactamase class C family)
MTIRHLMTHTSGLGYAWSSPIVSRLTENVRERETQVPLLHDPGSEWTYSAGPRVLGQIVEKISGQPLDVFFRERIFDPLKMLDTSFAVPPEKLLRVATLHSRVDGKLVEQPNTLTQEAPVRGDGGLYSTARDYGTFLQTLLNGGSLQTVRLLGENTVRMMAENHIAAVVVQEQPAADPGRTRPFPLGAGRDKFGLGFQIAARDERYATLRSPGSLSWAGINNTHFWIDPNRRVAVVVLMQVLPFYDEVCIGVLRGFEELVYRHLG